MEARLLRICVIDPFGNIRFDSNALAPRHRRTYDFIDPSLEPTFPGCVGIRVTRSIGALMDRLLRYFLGQFIRRGTMNFTAASGTRFTCGDGTGRPVSARFLTERTQRRILLNPELAVGEAYMDGTFVVENGSIADALAILLDQPEMVPRWAKLQWWLRYFSRHAKQFNWRGRAKNNVAHHYDLDGRLYSLFLDADRQYSCAYFETPDTTLDDAQLAKKRHLAAKLLIGRCNRVLDIGSAGAAWPHLAMTGADVMASRCRRSNCHRMPTCRKEPHGVGKIPAERLPRYCRPVRPHRVGRHVRTCRHRLL
jgi:cyclopropane-fatty-acyl-phospholipid synthase